jgi:predicted ester cyclase
MDDVEKKAQIEQIFDCFNRRDLDALAGIFHPDYVDHSPMGDIHGVPAFTEFVGGWLDAFPDCRFELSNIIVEGDLAAWQARFTGTNSGSMMGMPATGKRVDVTSIEMGRLGSDDRPIEHWTGNVQLMLLQQLGLEPSARP